MTALPELIVDAVVRPEVLSLVAVELELSLVEVELEAPELDVVGLGLGLELELVPGSGVLELDEL